MDPSFMDFTVVSSSPRYQLFDSMCARGAAAREQEFLEVLEELRKVRAERQSLLDQHEDVERCKSTLALREAELSALQAELQHAQAERDACRASCVALEEKRRQDQSDHVAKIADISAAHDNELSALRTQFLAMQAERDSSLTRSNQMENDLDNANKELLIAKAEGEGHRIAFEKLEEEFQNTRGALAQHHSESLREADQLKRELSEMRTSCQAQRGATEKAKQELQALQLEHNAQGETLDAVKRRAADHESECKRLLDTVGSRDSDRFAAHKEVTKARADRERLVLDVKRIEAELVTTRFERDSHRAVASESQRRAEAIAAKCEHLEAALANSTLRPADVTLERAALPKELADRASTTSSSLSTNVGSPASTAPPSRSASPIPTPRQATVSLPPPSPPTSPKARSPRAKMDQSRSTQAQVRGLMFTSLA